jgi:hypothetical protein
MLQFICLSLIEIPFRVAPQKNCAYAAPYVGKDYHRATSPNNRGSGLVLPGSYPWLRLCRVMIANWVSVNVMQIKATCHLATLNYSKAGLGILKRQ